MVERLSPQSLHLMLDCAAPLFGNVCIHNNVTCISGVCKKAPRAHGAFAPWVLRMGQLKLLAAKKRLRKILGVLISSLREFGFP